MYESNMAIAALILFLNVISSTRQLHDVGIGLKKSVETSKTVIFSYPLEIFNVAFMKFHNPKKFWEIPKNIIKTTEAIGSISYSGATYSEILKILTIVKYMRTTLEISREICCYSYQPTEGHVLGNF